MGGLCTLGSAWRMVEYGTLVCGISRHQARPSSSGQCGHGHHGPHAVLCLVQAKMSGGSMTLLSQAMGVDLTTVTVYELQEVDLLSCKGVYNALTEAERVACPELCKALCKYEREGLKEVCDGRSMRRGSRGLVRFPRTWRLHMDRPSG